MLIRAADGPTSAVIRTLMVVYQRLTGRTGPGAGRPAKLYRRSDQHLAVSLPQRRYDLAGRLLSSALEHAERSGDSPRAVLDQRAYQLGQELGDTARKAHGDRDTRDTALRVLQQYGFEPRIEGDDVRLANCPFHALAQEYTKLVCGMNIRLLAGLPRWPSSHRTDRPPRPRPIPMLRPHEACRPRVSRSATLIEKRPR